MANRFLETNYYKSPFVRSLKGSLKSLYSFIICDCAGSGVWPIDLEAASMYTGFKITMEEFKENFVNKGKAIDLGNGRYFFPDFIEHQYPKGLKETNPAHSKIILELKKFDLIDEKNNLKSKKKEAPFKPLESYIGNGNGNGSVLGNGNEHESKNDKFIIQQMCEIWYNKFSSYTKDVENDFMGMGKILQFILKNGNHPNFNNTPELKKIIVDEVELIANEVFSESFWVNKPIKSIANNIQEFYNNIKNPIRKNGTETFNSSNGKRKLGTSDARIEKLRNW